VKSLHLGKRVSEATKSVLKSQFKSIGQMMELNFDNFFSSQNDKTRLII